MWFFASFLLSALAIPQAIGASIPSTSNSKECVNSPTNRACWRDGYNISTNYYEEVPDTGVTREYWFNVENTTAAPDGVELPVQLINGSFPGPTIIADWGDTVIVHVTNSLQSNGTGLHFHGIRQNWTDQMDGVPSITQCPIAPGQSYTYKWRAVEYGTGWYHSHFYVQAWDGVFGGILINGPATANYDVDLGHIFLNDWYHKTADELVLESATSGPPTPPNGLINGTNTYGNNGSRFETTFDAGTRYRIRLVNAAADNHFRFMIDNHTMEVIAADFVPIHPYNTTQLSIGMGQRYDVIVTAKQLNSGNFWLRAIPQEACSETDGLNNIKGIIRYDNSSTADPTTSAWTYTDSCADESSSDLIPYVAINASDNFAYSTSEEVAIEVASNALLWTMNKTSFHTEWDYPTLMHVANHNYTWAAKERIIHLPYQDQWVYLVVHSPFAQDHPMHLHGHDFWVLASGYGDFDATKTDALTLVNAPRRDVAMMPASGYLVIAIKTNNPGAWLMHCHIAWHTSEGFAVQLLERAPEIIYDYETLNDTCASWKSYIAAQDVVQHDSGV
ncbi:multicopper oxidase [Aspergillus vadensis CBS 113365]|uniref:laccase n=1 Tax=Aspergillus vadensis (strain CBS 113365 / IMI 142717 / IBT 24658) TaxID=1448311 RepID=A0A319B8B0_ASPVC|nr:extracellular dihydrogeodin oxidase/laccase [Aspergillus vadensis CBS 113365]PYH68064.1 extracellular dihydrogeodin oxidase/laccase [Aspergillus vadensis CBS 113365]